MNEKAKIQLLEGLGSLPRVALAQSPTPLQDMERLSDALGGPRILFKRDDLTGAGLGGNKVRKLEYVIGRALVEQADTLVVCGGFQSNLARITAAVGSKLGLHVELVLGGVPGEAREPVGNLMLDHLYGANVRFVETQPRWEFGSALEDVMSELRGQGRRPYLIPLGASSPEGMASYIDASAEMVKQFLEQNVQPDYLYVAVGSGGTYSGLMLGQENIGAIPYEVVGISVSRTTDYYRESLASDMNAAASQLGLSAPQPSAINIDDRYKGSGYGEISDGCNQAIAKVASTEGILLDPVYSGKCMHGLIEHIRQGRIGKNDTVVFLHTGGWPALFSYSASQLGVDTTSKWQAI